MTSEVNNNNNNNIKKIELKDEIKEEDLCQICFSDINHEKLACNTCNKSMCITCCNNLVTRSFGVNDKFTDIEDKTLEFDDEKTIVLKWNCTFCRKIVLKDLIDFTKNDLIKLSMKDYINGWHTEERVRSLQKAIDDEHYSKVQMASWLLNNPDTDDLVKHLLVINDSLQDTNKHLIKDLSLKELDNELKNVDMAALKTLKKEILELKKKHIIEFNNQASQANINFEQAKIIKNKNKQIEKQYKELEKKNNEIEKLNKELKENYDNLNKTTLKANGNVLESYFKIDELHRVLSETYNKVKEEFESYLRPSKRESKMYNLFIKTIKQTMKIPREIKTSIDPNNKHQNMEFNNKDLIEYKNNII